MKNLAELRRKNTEHKKHLKVTEKAGVTWMGGDLSSDSDDDQNSRPRFMTKFNKKSQGLFMLFTEFTPN